MARATPISHRSATDLKGLRDCAATLDLNDLPARVAERYRRMVRDLEAALGKDVNRARAIVRDLVGQEIRVAPSQGREHLVAKIATGAEALFQASGGSQIMLVPGIGLEPTTRALRMRCSTN